jgi:hypothetical protein
MTNKLTDAPARISIAIFCDDSINIRVLLADLTQLAFNVLGKSLTRFSLFAMKGERR